MSGAYEYEQDQRRMSGRHVPHSSAVQDVLPAAVALLPFKCVKPEVVGITLAFVLTLSTR